MPEEIFGRLSENFHGLRGLGHAQPICTYGYLNGAVGKAKAWHGTHEMMQANFSGPNARCKMHDSLKLMVTGLKLTPNANIQWMKNTKGIVSQPEHGCNATLTDLYLQDDYVRLKKLTGIKSVFFCKILLVNACHYSGGGVA
mmetsp:Transcript_121689/g.211359  ORF Transcript_121689/g.211359 Transcript_121689/m.211359 type:complete len:142 (-) Transcript_121689:2810-3235(-)